MGDALSDGDEEVAAYSPINPHHESENEHNSDSDSLDAMLKGLSHSLRQQNKQPAPQGAAQASSKLASNAVGSTRSSSAGANDSPARLTRHTSSGGDSRTFTAERKNTLSPHSPQAGHAFERADISSAHEHFDDLMENFRADDFFRQSSVVRLLHTNASGELVEGKGASDKPKKVKTKKLLIPKHLQNTPYFKHYQKHTEGISESTSAAALHGSEGNINVKKAHTEESDGATIKATSKVPLLARKKQLATELQSAALAGSVSAPVLLDESALKLQQSHHMKPGKVASLMEMVTKARIKLKNGGTAVDSATEASEAETDTEPHKVSHSKHSAPHHLSHVDEHTHPMGQNSMHPSYHSHHASGAGTGRVTPQMSYKAATDAELDAFVPSLQPPSVPSALPVPALSFSRKTLGPAGIPLPPLSKDNLTILLKGKDPDALQAQQQQQQQAKPSKKSSKKVSKNKEDTKASAPAEKDSAKLSRKAAVPKTKTSGLAGSNKSRKSLSGRYAHAFEEDGDEEMGDDLHLFSPDQRRHQGVNGNHLYSSQVKFAPEDEAFDADEEEANSDQELEEAEQLQEEYSRLRSEFNAKLQQAAAFNQVRQSSQRDSHDANNGEDFQEDHGQQYYENETGYNDEAENPDEAQLAGVAASGSVTQSYSEGIPKISTQDLLRMWAIEDAEEEALRVSESQKAAQPVGAGASEKASSKTGDVYSVITAGVAEPSRGDANIRVSSKHNDNNTTASLHGSRQSSGRGSGSRYAQYDHQDEASSDEEVQNTTALRRSTNSTPQQPGNNASFKAADGVVPIPVKTLPADDAGLDDACLSFMNKMATKLPVPKI
uniref:Uncharacterized protein n=1 Tax=Spumella elongata TaxID=89044 RepID=A0A7S3HCJ9_9STRA